MTSDTVEPVEPAPAETPSPVPPEPAPAPAPIRRARSPLPLDTDGSGRFLPWLIALMVFLAALAIAGASLIGSGIARWDGALQGTLTAQLPRAEEGASVSDRLNAALDLIRAAPGVASVTALDDRAADDLLAPWLGKDVSAQQLPLPTLIDIQLNPGAEIDREALEQRLSAIVPGATVERRGPWLDRLFRVARVLEYALLVIVVLVGAVAVTAVVFTTRTGLSLHGGLIDLLHVMGATDAYIAQQFQLHAFKLGLRGGIIGLIGAFLTLGAIRLSAEGGVGAVASELLNGARLPISAALSLFLLPVVMGGVGWVTARTTVLRSLARMP